MIRAVEVLFFCLAAGAALGCLFLLLQSFRIAFHLGKLATAMLDLFYCCFCAVAAFLCALAVEHGRLRLFQVCFQILGGWAAINALGPFTAGAARLIRSVCVRVHRFFEGLFSRFAARFFPKRRKAAKKKEKTGKKAGKASKKDLKNLCRPVYNKKKK